MPNPFRLGLYNSVRKKKMRSFHVLSRITTSQTDAISTRCWSSNKINCSALLGPCRDATGE